MKKILLLTLSTIFAFAINFNTASKADLMELNGIGNKKAEAIMKYRKSHKINSANDLVNVKGIGKGIVAKVTGKKSIKKLKNKKSKLKSKISSKKEQLKRKKNALKNANGKTKKSLNKKIKRNKKSLKSLKNKKNKVSKKLNKKLLKKKNLLNRKQLLKGGLTTNLTLLSVKSVVGNVAQERVAIFGYQKKK